MARPKGICTYCGTFGPLHMDHVPPENLFERGQKSNLVTVPCCYRCNNTASKEDQYFLVYLAICQEAKQKQEHDRLRAKMARTLKRKEASEFRKNITKRVKFVQSVTPAGLILPPALSIPVDPRRVVEVLIRIIKGLYFREIGARLPGTHCVLPYDELAILHALQNVNPAPGQNFSLFPTLIREVENTPRNTIGNIFAYNYASNTVYGTNSLWLLDFSSGIRFFCIIRPPLSLSRISPGYPSQYQARADQGCFGQRRHPERGAVPSP